MAQPKQVYTADIKGEKIQFHAPTDTQLAFMGRAAIRADRAQRKELYRETITAVADMLDIVDSLFIEETDREYVAELMLKGQLEIEELMGAIEYARLEAASNAPTNGPVKPRVRRGSAR